MNEFFKNLKNEAQHIRLSSNEKQRIRVALYEAMKVPQPPAREVVAVRAVRSTYVWFSPRFALPVAVILVLGLGTGTAFAAQGSLPGDALYAIKINVNEPVEVALATTPAAKAATEEAIAGRRVVEAQTLAAQGRLDATTTQELEDNFDRHASRALAFSAQEAAATTSNEATSTEVPSTLVTISAATSATTTGVGTHGGEKHQPLHAAFSAAPVAPGATSTEEMSASDTSTTTAEENLSQTLQKQKDILNGFKQRFNRHDRGSDNGNNNDSGINSSDSNQGGTQNGAQNVNWNGRQNNDQGDQ